jgi:hypothetical protein
LKKTGLFVCSVACLLILFLTAVQAASYQVTRKAGDLTVDVTIDRNPPVVGKNNVDMAIKDSAGKSVTDANVVVEYSMPAMPGMPAMNYKADAVLKGNRYKTVMDLSMSGSWNITIRVTRAEKTQTAKFTVDAK